MSRNAGERTVVCRYCGQYYKRTNWMIRTPAVKGFDGRYLNDTHLISCERKDKTKRHNT